MNGVDRYLTLVDPLWTRAARGIVEAVTPLTPESAAVTIRTNRAWPGHAAGQFVTVGVEIDGVRHQRTYSLTSIGEGPGRQLIEIAVQRVPGGLVSNHLCSPARVGDVVHLDGPGGDFTLPRFVPERLLFLSAGSGVTPMVGMLRTLATRPPQADVVLVHHAPSPELTMFGAELQRLDADHEWLTAHVVHTRVGAGARLDAARLDAVCPDWAAREAFMCGPESLIAFATDHWDAAGVLDRLRLERFTPPTAAAAISTEARDGAPTASATFGRSGVIADAPVGSNLLAVAESAGVLAPSGCRTGVCHTCSTRLVSGCTTDLRDGRVTDAGSHVQLCVSAPLTDVVLDV